MCHDPEAFSPEVTPAKDDGWDFLRPTPAAATSDPEDDPGVADALAVFGVIEERGSPEEFEAACPARLCVESMEENFALVERPVVGAGRSVD
jgi:hypothetical protein